MQGERFCSLRSRRFRSGSPPFHSERKTAAQCEEASSYSMQDPAEPVMEVVLFTRQDAVEARGNAYADYAPAR